MPIVLIKELGNFCIILVLCTIIPSYTTKMKYMNKIVQWYQIEYEYLSRQTRKANVQSGDFILGNSHPNDVDIHYSTGKTSKNHRLFITTPRYNKGVPASLGIVTRKNLKGHLIIAPYPSWKWHLRPSSCNTTSNFIISAIRIQIDSSEYLWVLDDGRINGAVICRAKLLCFSLKSNNLIRSYEIPSEHIATHSSLTNFVVENNKFVYIADGGTGALIVCNLYRKTSWRIDHQSFKPDPNFEIVLPRTIKIYNKYGVFGLALAPAHPLRIFPKLFYYSLPSNLESFVETYYLKSKNLSLDIEYNDSRFFTYPDRQDGAFVVSAITSNEIMVYGSLGDPLIRCRNINGPFSPESIHTVLENFYYSHHVVGLKIINNPNAGEEVLILTTNTTSSEIQIASVDFLLKGTNCN